MEGEQKGSKSFLNITLGGEVDWGTTSLKLKKTKMRIKNGLSGVGADFCRTLAKN
jgi:hypothetical protein